MVKVAADRFDAGWQSRHRAGASQRTYLLIGTGQRADEFGADVSASAAYKE